MPTDGGKASRETMAAFGKKVQETLDDAKEAADALIHGAPKPEEPETPEPKTITVKVEIADGS